ncbi:MAG: adenylyl-sulfate kinase [Lentisphaerae bacterium RIFOXYA12_FULL_48_11]|nr:MAG: adenylyl-sulfate kinase [Lentisphaerae bacterium RIFOXYA12_FULL_48_11]
MNVVVVGHVDHGKSTIIGRLLADTHSIPDGKLEQVKATCTRNAKPFEYAFLLDALKDEQAQGITIDTARSFFKTEKRRYIIIDAPGHIEFLKNMITGASRADAAFIVIDAKEGIQENSRRHGYIMSMLGINQVAVIVNKMDLVGYNEQKFNEIAREYSEFLGRLNLRPVSFIPISAINGVNIGARSTDIAWHKGPTVLEQFDAFELKDSRTSLPFRLPVQDIYKFTEAGDDRRIFAGTISSGTAKVGDEIVFLPSGKTSSIKSIESFNTTEKKKASTGEATGFTLTKQVYVKQGELMVKASDPMPLVGARFRANIFWMGKAPLIREKRYTIKLNATRSSLKLVNIINVIDASDLSSEKNKQQVDRHDVAECILETLRPVAFDLVKDIKFTGRFVIIDNYEIAGAGIILEKVADQDSTLHDYVRDREFSWESGTISPAERAAIYGHGAKFVVFTGDETTTKDIIATELEKQLIHSSFKTYYLRMSNVIRGLDSDIKYGPEEREEHIRRLGELARILTDSGQIFITSVTNVDDYDIKTLQLLNSPHEILVVNIGENKFNSLVPDLNLEAGAKAGAAVEAVFSLLRQKKVLLDFQI